MMKGTGNMGNRKRKGYKVTVLSKPNAAVRVERINLTEPVRSSLTTRVDKMLTPSEVTEDSSLSAARG